jgi:hypothetical protein
MAQRKKLSHDEVHKLALEAIGTSNLSTQNELSREIEENIKYYLGELPLPARGGSSTYVSQDVWDCVESLKAQMLETFSGNRVPVRFAPAGAQDVEGARVATEVVNYVYSRHNNGFMINQAVIHNGLLARNGIVKVYWNEKKDYIEKSYQNQPIEAVYQILADESVSVVEHEEGPDGLSSGVLRKEYDASNVMIEVVPPEDFIIAQGAVSKESAEFIGTRTLKSKSDLLKMGYPANLVDRLGTKGTGMVSDIVKVARFGDLSSDTQDAMQEQGSLFYLYEIFMRLDKEGKGTQELYKLVFCEDDGCLFSCEEVNSIPLFSFTPLPIPHSFYGANYVDRASHIQRAKTTITRGILEHTVMTNNPRYQVLKGGLSNPRELIDNRLGGIVNVTRPDAISALEQPPLNPFAFSVVEKLDADKEDNTGVSRLSKGLNKDAISKQNSADMVGDLTSLSMQRQKMIARNFAEGFLRDVYLYIYELVLNNAGPEYVAEIAGEFQPIDVSTWRERKDAIVEFNIGYQEDEKEFAWWMGTHQMLSADPSMTPMYTPEKKFNVLKRALESKGIRDVQNVLETPDKIQPPQPDPVVMKELEIQDKLAQARIIEAETNRLKVQADIEQKKMELAHKAAASADDMDLQERKFEHDVQMDAFEQAIVERQAEAGAVTASANVNSSKG